MNKIEDVLKHFTSKIPSIKNLNYWERLEFMKLNSQQRRLERYKILYTWKILERIVPNCGVNESVSVNEGLNERRGRLCDIPIHISRKASIQSMREASFQMSGPKLFNKLPKHLRNLSGCGIDEFKKELDIFLAFVPDEPKCPGLIPGAQKPETATATNSLLHQIDWARRNGLLVGLLE